jgi:hypothetical protein
MLGLLVFICIFAFFLSIDFAMLSFRHVGQPWPRHGEQEEEIAQH